jgi:hypothetical protein
MALLKFELTEQHIALGKFINLNDLFEYKSNPNQKKIKQMENHLVNLTHCRMKNQNGLTNKKK